MALAHLRIRLEAARREDDRARSDRALAVGEPPGHPGNAALVGLEADRLGLICHGDAGLLGQLEEPVGEPDSPTNGLDDEPTPEADPAAALERLPPVCEGPPDAPVAQPGHRGVRPGG